MFGVEFWNTKNGQTVSIYQELFTCKINWLSSSKQRMMLKEHMKFE